mgnify:CR=1 FL=1
MNNNENYEPHIETDAVSGLYIERLLDSAVDVIQSLEEPDFMITARQNGLELTVKVTVEDLERDE